MTPNPQALGKAHEAWVESQHREALRLGLLAFEPEHNEPQVQRVRGRLVRVKRSVSDWTGMLSAARGSRLFAAEAKATVGERIPKSAVRPHQARYLTKVAAGGGLAALVVAFRAADDTPRRCAIPWAEVPWSTGRWKLGLRLEDALPWEVREGECYVKKLLAGEIMRKERMANKYGVTVDRTSRDDGIILYREGDRITCSGCGLPLKDVVPLQPCEYCEAVRDAIRTFAVSCWGDLPILEQSRLRLLGERLKA